MVVTKGPEPWADGWAFDSEMDPPVEKVEPTSPVDVLDDDEVLFETDSWLDPEVASGRNSDDDEDGARVAIDEPTE